MDQKIAEQSNEKIKKDLKNPQTSPFKFGLCLKKRNKQTKNKIDF